MNDAGGFRLRPPERFPASLTTHLRASLADGAGRLVRVWIEEMHHTDRARPATLMVAAEIKADPWDEQAHAEAEADLRLRVLDDVDSDRPFDVMVFSTAAEGGAGSLPGHFRALEPLFGPRVLRDLDLAAMSRLLPAPRKVPTPRATEPDQTSGPVALVIVLVLLAAAVGLSMLALSFVPWAPLAWGLVALIGAAALFFSWAIWASSVPGSMGGRKGLKDLPMTLAAVVQAHEALWERNPAGYPEGARFGLVAVFTLDPQWRDDPFWLSWMARRLQYLRDNPTRTAEETAIAQRLEGERDDGTSRVPASVAGTGSTYWVSPLYTRDQFPERQLPEDGLLPILLERDAAPGVDAVKIVRPWPAALWPLAGRSDRPRYDAR